MGMRFYNIHDILKIGTNFDLGWVYEYFRTNFVKPDIVFLKTNFDFDKKGYGKVGLKFFGGNRKLYFESMLYGFPLQKILIENLESKRTEIKFNRISKWFKIKALVNLLIEIKFLQKDCTFVHAAGISVNDDGYLICGFGESGKSLTALKICKTKKAKLLGDDIVIVSKKGYIYSFPTKICIFSGSDLAKEIELSSTERIGRKLRYLFSKMPPLYYLVNSCLILDPERLVEVGEKAKLKKIIFPQKGEKKLQGKGIINPILNATMLEFYSKFVFKVFYSYCFLNDFHFEPREKIEEILKNSIKMATMTENVRV